MIVDYAVEACQQSLPNHFAGIGSTGVFDGIKECQVFKTLGLEQAHAHAHHSITFKGPNTLSSIHLVMVLHLSD